MRQPKLHLPIPGLGNTTLTSIIANTSKRTNEMLNVRSQVADPMASTEIKILNGTSLAVISMPLRSVDCFSVNSQDANPPTKDFQEKIIIKDTCDYVITFSSNH